jgi:hypothetical protein
VVRRTIGVAAPPKPLDYKSTKEEITAFRAASKAREQQWREETEEIVAQEAGGPWESWVARVLDELFYEARWQVVMGQFADGRPLREQNQYRASLLLLACEAVRMREMVVQNGGGVKSDDGDARDLTEEEAAAWHAGYS